MAYLYYLRHVLAVKPQRLKASGFPCYLLNGIGLHWHLNNSFWIQKISNVATNNINIWFLTYNALSDLGKLDLIVLLIAEKLIQESFHTFLKLSSFSFLLVVITTAQIYSTKPELILVQIKSCSTCWRFAMVRMSDNGPGWK